MNKSHWLYTKILAVSFLIAGIYSCGKKDQYPLYPPDGNTTVVTYNWNAIADSAQNSLVLFYNTAGKYYTSSNVSSEWTAYWPTAHTLDVLVDGYLRTRSADYLGKMNDLLVGMKAKNGNTWLNHFYDDMEWMALASLRAYEATNDAQYKAIADALWVDIKNGWSSELGGGIWWNKDRNSKNAPSNMPAAIFAARLYNDFGKAEGLTWAKNIYDWQKEKLYDASSGWVKDHITIAGVVKPDWKFTYNQGTFAGAAFELYKATGDAQYLNDALKAIDYCLNAISKNGILNDEGGGDGGLFKGIFVRYLTQVILEGNLPAERKTVYVNFLRNNAQTLWSDGTNKRLPIFNSAWTTSPGDKTDLTTQLSGIMLLEAVTLLKKSGAL